MIKLNDAVTLLSISSSNESGSEINKSIHTESEALYQHTLYGAACVLDAASR